MMMCDLIDQLLLAVLSSMLAIAGPTVAAEPDLDALVRQFEEYSAPGLFLRESIFRPANTMTS